MLNMRTRKGMKHDSDKPEARYFYLKELTQLRSGNVFLVQIAEAIEQLGKKLEETETPVLEITVLHDRLITYYLDVVKVEGFIKEISTISKLGVKKYGMYNYRNGLEVSRIFNALCRHWIKIFLDPQGIDPESGVHHMAHVFANVYILWANIANNDMREVSNES